VVDRWGRRRWWLAAAVSGVVLLAGCAPAASGPAAASGSVSRVSAAGGTTAPALPDCTGGMLPTVTAGTITVGTGSPGMSPWYVGGSPDSGEGLESAVAYAVAQALGYGRDRVAWVVVDRGQAAAGAARAFDVDLDQFTAPDAGTATADYSTGYFSVTDTLVTRQTGAAPVSAAALSGMALGAVAGTDSVTGVQLTGADPAVFADQQQALAALAAGTVTGVLLPTPAALAAAAADPGLRLVGQVPSDPMTQPEQFKVLLPKGSALTGCVSAAVDRLRVEGTLEQLAGQWVDPLVPALH